MSARPMLDNQLRDRLLNWLYEYQPLRDKDARDAWLLALPEDARNLITRRHDHYKFDLSFIVEAVRAQRLRDGRWLVLILIDAVLPEVQNLIIGEELQTLRQEIEDNLAETHVLQPVSSILQKKAEDVLMKMTISQPEPPVDFVIVTALEEERDAILAKLPGYRKLAPSEDDVRVYYWSELPTTFADGSTGTYQITVMPLLGMGRVQAATATADAIHLWRPRYVILVGIAGGVAARRVKLGDILISDQIVDYELQKLTPAGPEIRWEVHRADPRLAGAALNFSTQDCQRLMKMERPDVGEPKRHIGPIASGDKVIAFGELLEKYRSTWPKLIGVEMEAAGAATAAFQAANPPGFFMVRGVSDLADEDKGSDYVERWRPYACDIAASYAIALLKSGPVPPQASNGT